MTTAADDWPALGLAASDRLTWCATSGSPHGANSPSLGLDLGHGNENKPPSVRQHQFA